MTPGPGELPWRAVGDSGDNGLPMPSVPTPPPPFNRRCRSCCQRELRRAQQKKKMPRPTSVMTPAREPMTMPAMAPDDKLDDDLEDDDDDDEPVAPVPPTVVGAISEGRGSPGASWIVVLAAYSSCTSNVHVEFCLLAAVDTHYIRNGRLTGLITPSMPCVMHDPGAEQ